MPTEPETIHTLTSCGPGALFSYELSGEYIIGRLFGLLPVRRIHLGAVGYLRLASRSEMPVFFILFNFMHLMPKVRSVRPVYILQTRMKHRIFLKMDGATHFRLRQAIGRYSARRNDTRMAA